MVAVNTGGKKNQGKIKKERLRLPQRAMNHIYFWDAVLWTLAIWFFILKTVWSFSVSHCSNILVSCCLQPPALGYPRVLPPSAVLFSRSSSLHWTVCTMVSGANPTVFRFIYISIQACHFPFGCRGSPEKSGQQATACPNNKDAAKGGVAGNRSFFEISF